MMPVARANIRRPAILPSLPSYGTSHGDSGAYALLEGNDHYSIVFNLLGVAEEDIGISLNELRSELTVVARRNSPLLHTGAFWTFGLPLDAVAGGIRARYRAGAMEIRIPKLAVAA